MKISRGNFDSFLWFDASNPINAKFVIKMGHSIADTTQKSYQDGWKITLSQPGLHTILMTFNKRSNYAISQTKLLFFFHTLCRLFFWKKLHTFVEKCCFLRLTNIAALWPATCLTFGLNDAGSIPVRVGQSFRDRKSKQWEVKQLLPCRKCLHVPMQN